MGGEKEPRKIPAASTDAIRRSMVANRGRDTSPELAVRQLLYRLGLRYRVNYQPETSLRRSVDIVFTRARIAVFIDGCFWHSCPQHGSLPRANAEFWASKLGRTQERDAETNAALAKLGWRVLRYWEHEAPSRVVTMVVAELTQHDESGGRERHSARSAS